MVRIFWDTNLFIYLFEENATFGPTVLEVYRRMKQRGDALLTSALTVGEILTKPLAAGNHVLADRYRRLFESSSVQVIDRYPLGGILCPDSARPIHTTTRPNPVGVRGAVGRRFRYRVDSLTSVPAKLL